MSTIDSKPIILLGHKRVDFKVVKEPFNIYKLKDGTIIKTKFVLIMVFFEKTIDEIIDILSSEARDKQRTGMAFKNQLVSGVDAPDNQKGTPTTEKNIKLSEHLIEEDVEVVDSEEYFFEYLLENGFTIKGKSVLINVGKADVFDENGMPYYLLDTSLQLKIVPPKKIKDMVTKIRTIEKK